VTLADVAKDTRPAAGLNDPVGGEREAAWRLGVGMGLTAGAVQIAAALMTSRPAAPSRDITSREVAGLRGPTRRSWCR
jgi:hypothetical protein